MTRSTNARLAGFTFLAYIATAFPAMVLFNRATAGVGTAAKLASIAQHAPSVRLTVVLSLLTIVEALVLAVALYAITRDQDPDIALLALSFRIGEGVIGAIPIVATMGLLAIATGAAGTAAAGADELSTLLLKVVTWGGIISATAFAVGSTLYSYLFLRARSIPVALAWLGVVASVLLVALLPAQLVGLLGSPVTDIMWMPMLLFEVVLGLWLLIKGVAAPRHLAPSNR